MRASGSSRPSSSRSTGRTVAALAGAGDQPVRRRPASGSAAQRTSPARRSPTSPPSRSANRAQPDTPAQASWNQAAGSLPSAETDANDPVEVLPRPPGSIRTGRTPVDQVDSDRAAEDPGADHHHLTTTAAIHTHLLRPTAGRARRPT